MKLNELRKRLRKTRKPKRPQKPTCGAEKAPQPTKHAPVMKLADRCAACGDVAVRSVYKCEPDLMQDTENGRVFVTLGEWWCIHCGAHHLTKLEP